VESQLRPDARIPFQQARKYLRKTSDSLFANPWTPVSGWTDEAVLHALQSGSKGQKLVAIEEVGRRPIKDASIQDELHSAVTQRDPDLRIGALQCLSTISECAELHLESVENNLQHHALEVRAAAAWSLRNRSSVDEHVSELLIRALDDDSELVVLHAAAAIRQIGEPASCVIAHLMPPIRLATVRCHYGVADELLKTLIILSENPNEVVVASIEDDELQSRILEDLERLMSATDEP